MTHPRETEADLLARLTPREREVLDLMCEGYSQSEICDALGMAMATARTHRNAIYRKLHVGTALRAVAMANRAAQE